MNTKNNYETFWKYINSTRIPFNWNPDQSILDENEKICLKLFRASLLCLENRTIECFDEVENTLQISPNNYETLLFKEALQYRELMKRSTRSSYKKAPMTSLPLYPNSTKSLTDWCDQMKKLRTLISTDSFSLALKYSQSIETKNLSFIEIIEFHLMRATSYCMINRSAEASLACRTAFTISPMAPAIIKATNIMREFYQDESRVNKQFRRSS